MYKSSNETNISEADSKSAMDIYKDASLPTVGMLLLFSVVGVGGNALVLIVYWKITKKTVIQMLIFVIAIFDFLTALVAIPGQVILSIFRFDYLDIPLCKIGYIISVLFVAPGLFLLVGVSFIRYLLICKPHLLPKFESKTYIFCGLSVGFGIFQSIYFGVVIGKRSGSENEGELVGFSCRVDDIYKDYIWPKIVLYINFLTFIFCMLGLIFTNISIIHKVIKQGKIILNHRNFSNTNNVSEEGLNKLVNTRSSSDQLAIRPMPSADTLDQGQNIGCVNVTQGQERASPGYLNLVDQSLERNTVPIHNAGSLENTYQNTNSGSTGVSTDGTISPDRVSSDIVRDGEVLQHISCDVVQQKNFIGKIKNIVKLKGVNRTKAKLALASFVYVIAYMPFFAIWIYRFLVRRESIYEGVSVQVYKYVYWPCCHLRFIGCALNPLIYTFVDPKFRSRCYSLFR